MKNLDRHLSRLRAPELGLGLRLGLSGPSAGGGSYTPVNGDPLSFAVSNASPIDPNGSGYGVFGNGWTATVVFKGLSASGNVNAFDGQKVTLSVTDPGYTTSGTTTTVNRTIKGSITLRKAWPNNGSRQITAVGSDLQLIICLEDVIYQGTTINSVTFATTAYPGSNALVLSGASVTNNSTLAYPKPYFAWLNRQYERATGSTYHVEAVAYHRHGMNGQMVACIEFIGKDSAAHVATTQRASAPALSTIQTLGNIVESWQADVPLTALDQTTTTNCKVHAKVYPWIGDSTAILDTEVSGAALPTYDTWVSLDFTNDKNGTYGGAFAYVKAGASGGTVSATAATARADPYATWAAAWAAIKTWNNANRSHNDYSGATIRLMDDGAGGAVTYTFTAFTSGNATNGLCWATTEADPLNMAEVRLQCTTAGVANVPTLTAIGAGVTVYNTASATTGGSASGLGGSNTTNLSLDGCVMDMSVAGSASGANYLRATYIWSRNVNWLSPGSHTKTVTNVNSNQAFVLMFGNTAIGGIFFDQQFCTIGNSVTSCQLGGTPGGTLTSTYSADGKIYANNSLSKVTSSSYSTGFMGTAGANFVRGMAVVQNLVEILSNGSTITFSMSNDSTINNVGESLDIHNTVVGNRGNWLYTDAAGAAGYRKRGVSRFSLKYSIATKEDTFAQDSGCVGNFEWAYKVGSLGTVNLCGTATEGGTLLQSGVDPSAGPNGTDANSSKWSGMYVPSNWYIGSGSTGYATVTFTDDKCLMLGTGVGGGDYHLTGGSNNAYDRVPSGLAMLKYDLGGASRLNNGSGAAGAYERS